MSENGKSSRYNTAAFWYDKIAGTGGIISTIARRADCDWHTAAKYCKPESTPFVTVGLAYLDELQRIGDLAESIVFDNMRLQRERQVTKNESVDTTDAKWYLTMKAKDRGYAERRELTGAGGGPLETNLSISQKEYERAIATFYDALGSELCRKGLAGSNIVGTSESATVGSPDESSR